MDVFQGLNFRADASFTGELSPPPLVWWDYAKFADGLSSDTFMNTGIFIQSKDVEGGYLGSKVIPSRAGSERR
jgi:hypothetical protein